ncbi:hypothetical protein Tco_1175982 [Tanacetum coccineum]
MVLLGRRCSCGWCGNKLDDGFCSYCASKAENSFAYDPNPNSFDNSPNFSYHPQQPQFETYLCELCGNNAHYVILCLVHSSRSSLFEEEFAGELAHIALIPPGIIEADFYQNDDTSSDDDDFKDVEYADHRKNEKLAFWYHEGLINIDISDNSTNDFLLELPKFESFHFDPSFPRPPPEPPDVEILEPENNNFDVLNNDESFDPREGENVVFLNVEEDDSFTFTIRTFLPFVTYPEVSLLSCSTGSEDTIFDPGIST